MTEWPDAATDIVCHDIIAVNVISVLLSSVGVILSLRDIVINMSYHNRRRCIQYLILY